MHGPPHPELKAKAVHQAGGMLPAGIYFSALEPQESFAILSGCLANVLPKNDGAGKQQKVLTLRFAQKKRQVTEGCDRLSFD